LGSEEPSFRHWLDLGTVSIGGHVRKLKFFSALDICNKLESRKIIRGETFNIRNIANSPAYRNECADHGQPMDERAVGEQGWKNLPATLGGHL
jgi:hypothetical protein